MSLHGQVNFLAVLLFYSSSVTAWFVLCLSILALNRERIYDGIPPHQPHLSTAICDARFWQRRVLDLIYPYPLLGELCQTCSGG